MRDFSSPFSSPPPHPCHSQLNLWGGGGYGRGGICFSFYGVTFYFGVILRVTGMLWVFHIEAIRPVLRKSTLYLQTWRKFPYLQVKFSFYGHIILTPPYFKDQRPEDKPPDYQNSNIFCDFSLISSIF